MRHSTPSRRQFLWASAATVAALSHSSTARPGFATAEPASSPGSLRLGAPLFDPPEDPEELALAHRKLGLRAAYCPTLQLHDRERIAEVAKAFAQHDVVLAEVGRWKNLLAADPVEQKQNLEFVCEGLALADAVGARCCVDIAGSFSTDSWFGPHPENLSDRHFEAAVENARKIIDSVKPTRAKFCYEMMGWALPDSPDSYLKMIRAVDRPAFGVHLDPCNLINSPARFYQNTELLNECFDQLAPWIVSCHAKDVAWELDMQVHFKEVVLGTGKLDYRTYLSRLAKLPDVPLMIEHMQNQQEYDQSRQFVFDVGQELGLTF